MLRSQNTAMPLTFDERYEIRTTLGAGEFATVHEVADRRSDERLAMKWAKPSSSLKDEFRLARAVTHPNVLRPHELGTLEGRDAYTMPIVDGLDVVAYVRQDVATESPRGPHLPMAFGQPLQPVGSSAFARCTDVGLLRLRAAFSQLTVALHALHEVGLAHRDLRPANVRVARDGHVTLIDFGLAARIGSFPTQESIGTVSHLAPECAVDARVTSAEDFYALGVLLFEALTGELPFFGTGQDVLLRKQTVGAPSPDYYVKDVPADLARTCASLLEPAPSLRNLRPDFQLFRGR